MTRYRITISYDGSSYFGWQIQPNGMTVQQKIQEAINRFTGESVKVHGSGRTDQGVHARGQVAHFDLTRDLPVKSVLQALNGILPTDIRILRVGRCSSSFHARRSARRKEYRYFIWNAPILPPFLRQYRTHVRERLDVDAMKAAAAVLEGRHDFAAFTANPNRVIESTCRDLFLLNVNRRGREIVIRASADGFLYKMVRSLAGFLIRVGQGELAPKDARAILNSGLRTARVPTAPPYGLFLWNVTY